MSTIVITLPDEVSARIAELALREDQTPAEWILVPRIQRHNAVCGEPGPEGRFCGDGSEAEPLRWSSP